MSDDRTITEDDWSGATGKLTVEVGEQEPELCEVEGCGNPAHFHAWMFRVCPVTGEKTGVVQPVKICAFHMHHPLLVHNEKKEKRDDKHEN